MQCFANDLIGDVGAVEIAGVDVIHAGRDSFAQHGQRRVAILGRPEHAGPRKLHGAIAKALHGAAAKGKAAGLADAGHVDLL